jgi:Flp pilus assembly protein TadG
MRKLLNRFKRDARGTVALIAGLSAIPLLLAAGVAVDMARASHEDEAFQSAVDSAALAVAASDLSDLNAVTTAQMPARMALLNDLAKKYINANYTPHFHDDTQIQVNVTVANNGTVKVEGYHDFPTAIMRIVGINEIDIGAHAQVNKAAGLTENVEIFLVMDTTGSMSINNKLVDAKAAAKLLFTEVLGAKTTDPHLKFALVPFSGSVNLGPTYPTAGVIDTTGAATVSKVNFTSATYHNMKGWNDLRYKNALNQTVPLPWNGCVEARLGAYATNDTAPNVGVPDTLFTPYFAPDESSKGTITYPNDYITASGSPNELSPSLPSSSSDSVRQKNQAKYVTKLLTNVAVTADGPWYNCAASSIVPLTPSRATIEAGIDAMTARGNTVLPEGLAWGWRVMSPTMPYTEGAAYNNKQWRKVVVFMTDGENDVSAGTNTLNGSVYTSYGYVTAPLAKNRFGTTSSSAATAALDTKLLTVCSGIKSKAEMRPNPKNQSQNIPSVELYTIGFQAPVASSILLKACATDVDHYYVNAANGQELKDAFRAIGERLKTMYLSE